MIIFGIRAKKEKVGEGEFFCPFCGAKRHYTRLRAKRYFSLYFIPLIPMGDLGEFVECQSCHKTFNVDVLMLKAPDAPPMNAAQLLNKAGELLNNGTPVEFLVRDLTAAGLDLDVALRTIHTMLTGKPQRCNACDLTFVPSVKSCSQCGAPLQADG